MFTCTPDTAAVSREGCETMAFLDPKWAKIKEKVVSFGRD
jgi:hypothetical protein